MFQKWSRSNSSNTIRALLFLLIFLVVDTRAWAAPIPNLLQEVQTKYRKSGTLCAEFTQVTEDKAISNRKKTSTGKIFVKRPSKIRWEVQSPDESLLISDGQNYLFYTPPFDDEERGQLIQKKATHVQSQLADALLTGNFSETQFLKIEAKGNSQFLLTPKPGTAGTVARATLEIDPTRKVIKKIILEHKHGNRSEVTLSQVELGLTLQDQLFTFNAPPNTDIIKSQP